MKKVLRAILFIFLAVLVTGGIFVFNRYHENPEQIVPLPYTFTEEAPATALNAPILIAGDRMGAYFAKFSPVLAETISVNLEKPIRIQSMAKEGHGLHRTLHELKGLKQWPQILIYQGASEEFSENKFDLGEISRIRHNFSLYSDDRLETLMILWPWTSRIIYDPIQRVKLGPSPLLVKLEEKEYLRRLETELLLFEQHLVQFVKMSKDRNSLLIFTTTPLNLDQAPHKICEFTTTPDIEADILGLRDLLKENNPKEAYTRSSKLVKQHAGNAELFYIHGQISKRLNYMDEAIDALSKASAYDCDPWRATLVHNSIIRKVAKEHQVLLFDFAQLLENEYGKNTTFFDEIHPQNLYYDKGMEQLGLVIKNILKL